jgi:hypothetical protein
MGNEKKSTVYKTGDEGLMRDVVNNRDVDKVHQDDKEIMQCARDEDPWEEGRRDKVISPLHDPGRAIVKQDKTNEDRKEDKRQLRKKGRWERYIRVVMVVATATATRSAIQGEKYTNWHIYAI